MPEIEYPLLTERLILRRFAAEDLGPYYAYQSLPETAVYLLNEPRTYAQCMARIARYIEAPFAQAGDWASFALQERTSGIFVGEIALKWGHGGKSDDASREPARVGEIGWTLTPASRGKGYATEAATAVLELAFNTLGFVRLEARLDARNRASAAICQRLGMVHEATLRNNTFLKGEWTSEAVYAVLREDYLGSAL